MSRSRSWCFTYHLGHEDHYEALLENLECEYLVFGRETCPTTGRQHLQGYVEFKHQKTMSAVKAWMANNQLHLEKRSGTAKEAADYCKKGEQSHAEWKEFQETGPNFGKNASFFEKGEISKDPKEGGSLEKDRWQRAKEAAKEGRFDDIDDEIYMRHYSTIKKIRLDSIQSKATLDGEFENEWFVGPSGSGKSKTARDENPDAFDKDPKERWWDGYNGEDVVLIDDFDKYQKAQGGDLKRWSDRYSFPATVKGGYMHIRPKKIVVTSQYYPYQIWDDQETLDAIGRRFKIREFGQQPNNFASNFTI